MKFLNQTLALFAITALGFTSCNNDDDDDTTVTPAAPMSITATAASASQFSILVDALTRTGLDGVLDDDGDYTVFAPTDKAFGELLDQLQLADLDALESTLGNDGLKNVLLYHVVGAKVMAADVTTGFVNSLGTRVPGMDKEYLDMYLDATSGVVINGVATVSAADIEASNGVIHQINSVILPLNLVELTQLSPDHTKLVDALIAADGNGDGNTGDLVTALSSTTATMTVFAPVNSAFDDVATVTAGLTEAQLGSVLLYHVVGGGNVTGADVTPGPVTTLSGQSITLDNASGVTVTDSNNDMAKVVAADVQGTNGVIHVIDRVLIPVL